MSHRTEENTEYWADGSVTSEDEFSEDAIKLERRGGKGKHRKTPSAGNATLLKQFEFNQWRRELLVSLARSRVRPDDVKVSNRFRSRVQNARWRLWHIDQIMEQERQALVASGNIAAVNFQPLSFFSEPGTRSKLFRSGKGMPFEQLSGVSESLDINFALESKRSISTNLSPLVSARQRPNREKRSRRKSTRPQELRSSQAYLGVDREGSIRGGTYFLEMQAMESRTETPFKGNRDVGQTSKEESDDSEELSSSSHSSSESIYSEEEITARPTQPSSVAIKIVQQRPKIRQSSDALFRSVVEKKMQGKQKRWNLFPISYTEAKPPLNGARPEPNTQIPMHKWITPYALQAGSESKNKATKQVLRSTSRMLGGHFRIKCDNGEGGEMWTKRYITLTDNFLFEFFSRKDSTPLSFAPLSEVQILASKNGYISLSLPRTGVFPSEVRSSTTSAMNMTPDKLGTKFLYRMSPGFEQSLFARHAGTPGSFGDSVHNAVKERSYPSRNNAGPSQSSGEPSSSSATEQANLEDRVVLELYPIVAEIEFHSDSKQLSDARELVARRWKARIETNSKLELEDLYELESISSETTLLGAGRYAKVHQVVRRSDGRQSAIKIIEKDLFWELVALGKERGDALAREISTHAYMTRRTSSSKTCGIANLTRVYETPNILVVEMELMSRMNLFQLVTIQDTGRFSEKRAADIAIGIIGIIQSLRKNGIAHRDIKLSNLVLQHGTDDRFKFLTSSEIRSTLRLIDFGMAAYIEDDGSLRGRCGTPGYVAPEILRAKPGEKYPSFVDMYSLGVMIFTLLSGYEPFQRHDINETLRANRQCEFIFYEQPWARISQKAKDFVSRLLTVDPLERMTPVQALNHPWLSQRVLSRTGSSASSSGNKFNATRSYTQPITSVRKNPSACVIS